MGKGKGFDPVADANEVAEHNINPYYWINRVTSFTFARWMAEKKLAAFVLPLYAMTLGAAIWGFANAARARHLPIWYLLFDFSDARALSAWASLIFLAFYTAVAAIMVLQVVLAPRKKPAVPQIRRRRSKQPKRRKDYQ